MCVQFLIKHDTQFQLVHSIICIYSMYYNIKICIVDLTKALLGPNELFVEVKVLSPV